MTTWLLYFSSIDVATIHFPSFFFKDFCEIKEVSKIEGDATANNRKAKLIFFYEWEIKGDWKGKFEMGCLFVSVHRARKSQLLCVTASLFI